MGEDSAVATDRCPGCDHVGVPLMKNPDKDYRTLACWHDRCRVSSFDTTISPDDEEEEDDGE